ncbi:MAG TPA: SRPBCC family protein [Candidatus Dormibacteraeota bacterium]
MIVKNRFAVDAPLDAVWRHLLNVPKVVDCVPGAQLTQVIDERTYEGKIGIKLGPIDVAYRGRVVLEEVDEQAHRVRLKAEGSESRGRGGASATMTGRLHTEHGQTVVAMESDILVTGLVAQFGRSAIMQQVSSRMADRFARCLEQAVKAETSAG